MTTDPSRVLLSKAGTPSESGKWVVSRGLPPVLLQQVVTRVRVVASLMHGTLLFGWVLGNLIEGQLLREFERPAEWGPPVFMIVASLVMLAQARRGRPSPVGFASAVPAYEVAVSAALAISTYYDTFATMPAVLMETDVVGVSPVAVCVLHSRHRRVVHPHRHGATLRPQTHHLPRSGCPCNFDGLRHKYHLTQG